MKAKCRIFMVFVALIGNVAGASELKVVPWSAFSVETENMKVVSKINKSGNFASLEITTRYGVYKMSKSELDQLSNPEVTTFEAVEFPGIKHTEYHLQFYHRGPNHRQNSEKCVGSGGKLDSDYIRIKVRVGNKVEIKPFPSSCSWSLP